MRFYISLFACAANVLTACGGVGPLCPKVPVRAYAAIYNRTGHDVRIGSLSLTDSEEMQKVLIRERWEQPSASNRYLGKFTPPSGPKRKYGSLNGKSQCAPDDKEYLEDISLVSTLQPAEGAAYMICQAGYLSTSTYYIFEKGATPNFESRICYLEVDGAWQVFDAH